MKLRKLRIRDYRTIEDICIEFSPSYAAICGPNDSGKTNVVRALRCLMADHVFHHFFSEVPELDPKNDLPKWKENASSCEVAATFVLDPRRDAGLFSFVGRQLALDGRNPHSELEVELLARRKQGEDKSVVVTVDGKVYDDGLEVQDIAKRFRGSRGVLFHNSTQAMVPPAFGSSLGRLEEMAAGHGEDIDKLNKSAQKALKKISRARQAELEQLLKRLHEKYRVSLTLPTFDVREMPYSLALSRPKHEVPLDDWGSGTRNRTMILLQMFAAKQISEAEASADKVTPILVIEEPESFLHPSAQAEFGRVIQDLSVEFDVQVILTTHSPYMLSTGDPESNVLLERKVHYGNLRQTEQVETGGDNWMRPFAQALGLESEEFAPWQQLFLSTSDALLLVEGPTDKGYFELLRGEEHGDKRLAFNGEIVSYDGTGALSNTILLRLIKNRYRTIFVTYDLDAEKTVEKNLKKAGLERKVGYCPVGLNAAGKRAVEGLVPEKIRKAVHEAHPDLVSALASDNKDEARDAKESLKKLYLEEFRATAKPGDDFAEFYKVVRAINRALA